MKQQPFKVCWIDPPPSPKHTKKDNYAWYRKIKYWNDIFFTFKWSLTLFGSLTSISNLEKSILKIYLYLSTFENQCRRPSWASGRTLSASSPEPTVGPLVSWFCGLPHSDVCKTYFVYHPCIKPLYIHVYLSFVLVQ